MISSLLCPCEISGETSRIRRKIRYTPMHMRGSNKQAQTPAAQLRQQLVTYFSAEELQAMSFDLGIDWETLSGDSKITKAGDLIQHAARNDKIVDLVNAARAARPNADWNDAGVAAATNAKQFLFVPDDKPLINAAPDRAMKLGVALGVMMVLLLGCGFGGGLVAGQVVSVTLKPVQPNPDSLNTIQFQIAGQNMTPQSAGATPGQLFNAIGNLPAGTDVGVMMDDVQATTIADALVKTRPNAPVTEPHIRFLKDGKISVNFRANALSGRRVALAYTARAEGGRLILTPVSANVNMVEVPNSTFGWVPLPVSAVSEATDWAQAILDAVARNFWFTHVDVSENKIEVDGTTR